MSHRLTAAEANGTADDETGEDLLSELVATVRRIDANVGLSPDSATGQPGSGLCKVVAELKSESDFRARIRLEKAERSELWRDRLKAYYSLAAGLVVVGGICTALIRLIFKLVNP